ncbi:MAG: NAD-dependent epimerase/dehydratase family protein [bacterium]|jgi:nucleoside-diphosphate-sugar epimerase
MTNSKYLILGATGSIGYAFARTLVDQKIPFTTLVRDRKKMTTLLGEPAIMEIAEGDAMNTALLKSLAEGKEFIFHGVNYPYDKWEENMPRVTANLIKAAAQNQATIIFPGNIYEFGNARDITEETVPHPTTKKGRIRLKIFEMLKNAAEEKKCKVIFLRLPDFFGPNVVNGLTERIFGHAVKKKAINWLIRSDIPHQFVYTPDAAALMLNICQKKDRPEFILYNYCSYTVPSFGHFAEIIAGQAGSPAKVQNLPKFIINIMGWFVPVMRELKENFYLFENNVNLIDDKIRADFPEFRHTPLEEAVNETLEWFGKDD